MLRNGFQYHLLWISCCIFGNFGMSNRCGDFGFLILCRSIPQSAIKFKINCHTYGFCNFENITMKMLENARTHIFEPLDFWFLNFRELATLKLILKFANFEMLIFRNFEMLKDMYNLRIVKVRNCNVFKVQKFEILNFWNFEMLTNMQASLFFRKLPCFSVRK